MVINYSFGYRVINLCLISCVMMTYQLPNLILATVLVTVVNGALVLYSENLWEILKWHMKTRLRFCFGLVEKN